jgi:hypothetical protein
MFEVHPELVNHPFTTSRMKKWFMVQFQGYTVVAERQLPKTTRGGRLTYEIRWYLRQC